MDNYETLLNALPIWNVNRMISISFKYLFNTSNTTTMVGFYHQCSELEPI